ncbi:MAG: hypothetical protein Q4F70_04115, partial [Clostridia bacterium]|nr:hypothetical protein [Clostridia bacterium]
MLDFLWVLVDGNPNLSTGANYIINACYFGTSGIVAYVWLTFVDHKVNGFLNSYEIRLAFAIPSFLIAFLAFTAPWNGLLFSIGPGNIYQRGSLFYIQPIVMYGYILLATATAVICSPRHRLVVPRSSERSFVIFSMIPIVGGVFQYFIPGLPVLNGCMTMAVVYIYIILLRE